MDDLREWFEAIFALAGLYIVIGVVVLVLSGIGGFIWKVTQYDPQVQHGYNQVITNLIAEYCSPDYSDHVGDLRSQIIQKVDGEPDHAAQLPTAIKSQVAAIRRNDFNSACGIGSKSSHLQLALQGNNSFFVFAWNQFFSYTLGGK